MAPPSTTSRAREDSDVGNIGKPAQQSYRLSLAPDCMVMRLRVTSSPEQFRRAGDLVDEVLRHLAFPGEGADEGPRRHTNAIPAAGPAGFPTPRRGRRRHASSGLRSW